MFSWCGHGAWTQPGSFLLSEPRAHPGSCCGSRGQGLSWGDHLWEVEGGGGDVASTALAGRPAGLWEAWRGDSSELSGTGPSCSQSRREVPVLQAEASWKWAQLPLPSRQAGNPHLPQGECLLWENSRQRAQGGVQGWGRLLVDLWPQVHIRGQQGHTGETSDQRTHSQSPACSFYEFYRFSSHIRLMVDLELIFARDRKSVV